MRGNVEFGLKVVPKFGKAMGAARRGGVEVKLKGILDMEMWAEAVSDVTMVELHRAAGLLIGIHQKMAEASLGRSRSFVRCVW